MSSGEVEDTVLRIEEDQVYPRPRLAWRRQGIGQEATAQAVVGGD